MNVAHSRGTYKIHFGPAPSAKSDGVVVTDAHVAELYPDIAGPNPIIITPGEESKNFATFQMIVNALAARRITRKQSLTVVGGGVVGDLAGFAAATYLRGISFTQIPTTLLSQVDSSVGGKVGIDLSAGKNLLGAFHPPSEVYIDSNFLKTLPDREFRSGMAEVLKYGAILDQELWSRIVTQQHDQHSLPEQVVEDCIELKRRVVEADEYETFGIRAKLNFGHTVGHAIEHQTQYMKFTHGEAIAIGMVIEAKIAELLGIAERGLVDKVAAGMQHYGLPVQDVILESREELVKSMKQDKKSESGELTMSLVTSIGVCTLVKDIPEDIVVRALSI